MSASPVFLLLFAGKGKGKGGVVSRLLELLSYSLSL